MTDYLAPVVPVVGPTISGARGSFVWDTEGRRYLDMSGGQFCAILGHSNPDVADFVARQARKSQNTSVTTSSEEALEAAYKVHRITADIDGRAVFLSTGAEANECALRHAKHVTGRPGVISFERGWHGLTLGTESASMPRRHVKPRIPNTHAVPAPPHDTDALDGYVEAFDDVANGDVAAAIFEPIVSSGGMLFPPAEYFRAVADICKREGILLIFDECQTGWGRTGSWFAYQDMGVAPDLVTCAKGMGLGYPVSAVIFNSRIVPPGGFAMQTFVSHLNDPFGCALVAFGIDYIEKHRLCARNLGGGRYLLGRLRGLPVGNPRGAGMMMGLDLPPAAGPRFVSAMRHRGVLLQTSHDGSVVRLLPNYLTTTEEVDLFIDTARLVLELDNVL